METRLLWGALEMLVLEVVSDGATWGYDITQQVLSRSDGRFELKEGSLYPALHRLERQKLLAASWKDADGRRRKYYRLTPAGVRRLAQKRQEWQEFSAGVNGVLGVHCALA